MNTYVKIIIFSLFFSGLTADHHEHHGMHEHKANCGQICPRSLPTKIRTQPGKTYAYNLETNTLINLRETQSVGIKARVEITSHNTCEHSLQLREVQLTGVPDAAPLQTLLEANPIQFGSFDGKVSGVCPASNDEKWVVSIKKAIISSLQISADNLIESSDVIEDDFSGHCKTSYSPQISGSDGVLLIEKTKDLRNCENRITFFGVHARFFSLIQRLVSSYTTVSLRTQKCVQKIESNIITSVDCDEEYTWKLRSNRALKSSLNLKLIETTDSTVAKKDPLSTAQALYHIHDEGDEEEVATESDVLKLLENICTQVSGDNVEPESTTSYYSLVKSLKTLPKDATRRVYTAIKSGEICSSPRLKSLFISASAFAATDSSIETVVNAYKEKELLESRAIVLFTIISVNAKPNEDTINSLSQLIESKQTARPLLLGISFLIRSYCKTNENCEQISSVKKAVQDLISRIRTSDSNLDIITSIKALENIKKPSEAAKPSLLALAQNTSADAGVRIAAIQALTKISDDQIRDALIEIFLKDTEDVDIRIAAYKSVVMSGATVEQLEKIKSENDEKVANYVKTHIRNIKKSKNTKRQQLLPPNAPDFGEPNIGLGITRNLEFSYRGVTIDGDIIHPKGSLVPSTITASAWVPIHGKDKQLLEISIRHVGLDTHVKKILSRGINGPEIVLRMAEELNELIEHMRQPTHGSDSVLQISVKLMGRNIIFSDVLEDAHTLRTMLTEQIRELSRSETWDEAFGVMADMSGEVPTLNGFPLLFRVSDTGVSGFKQSIITETTGDSPNSKVVKIRGNRSAVGQAVLRSTLKVANYRPGVEIRAQSSITLMIDVLVETRDRRILKAKINLPKDRYNLAKLTQTTRLIDFNGQPKETNEVSDNEAQESNEANTKCRTRFGMLSMCRTKTEVEGALIPNVEYYILKNDKSMDSLELLLERPPREAKEVRLWTAKLSPSNGGEDKTLSADIELLTPSEGKKQLNIKLKSPNHSLISKSSVESDADGKGGKLEIDIQCPNHIDFNLKSTVNRTNEQNNVETNVNYKLGHHSQQQSIKWTERSSFIVRRTKKIRVYNVSFFGELITTQYPEINHQISYSTILKPYNSKKSDFSFAWNQDFKDKIVISHNAKMDVTDFRPFKMTTENELKIEAKPYDVNYEMNLNSDISLVKGKPMFMKISLSGKDLEGRDERNIRGAIDFERIENPLSQALNATLSIPGREMGYWSDTKQVEKTENQLKFNGIIKVQLNKGEVITVKHEESITNPTKDFKLDAKADVSYSWKPEIQKHSTQLGWIDDRTFEIKRLVLRDNVKEREGLLRITDRKEVKAYGAYRDTSVEININDIRLPTEADIEVKNGLKNYKLKASRIPRQSVTVKMVSSQNSRLKEFESHVSLIDKSSVKLLTSEGSSLNAYIDLISERKRYHVEINSPQRQYSHIGDVQYLTKEDKIIIDSRTNKSGTPYLTIEGQLTCKERSFLIIKKIKSPDNVSKFEYFYDNGKYGLVLESSRFTAFAEGERYPKKFGKIGFFDKTENYEHTSNYSVNNGIITVQSISNKDKAMFTKLDAVLGRRIVSNITLITPKINSQLTVNPLANPKTLNFKWLSDKYDQKTDIEYIPNNQIKINSLSQTKVEPIRRMTVEGLVVRDRNRESSFNISVPQIDFKFRRTVAPNAKHVFDLTLMGDNEVEEYDVNTNIHPIASFLINLSKHLRPIIMGNHWLEPRNHN